MKIIDENGDLLAAYDPASGRLKPDRMLVAHHAAVESVAEVWHYETVREYPNGGKDVQKVIDIPGIEAAEAWDEYEDVLRFIAYTPEELAQIEANREETPTARIAALEEALEMILTGVTE